MFCNIKSTSFHIDIFFSIIQVERCKFVSAILQQVPPSLKGPFEDEFFRQKTKMHQPLTGFLQVFFCCVQILTSILPIIDVIILNRMKRGSIFAHTSENDTHSIIWAKQLFILQSYMYISYTISLHCWKCICKQNAGHGNWGKRGSGEFFASQQRVASIEIFNAAQSGRLVSFPVANICHCLLPNCTFFSW